MCFKCQAYSIVAKKPVSKHRGNQNITVNITRWIKRFPELYMTGSDNCIRHLGVEQNFC